MAKMDAYPRKFPREAESLPLPLSKALVSWTQHRNIQESIFWPLPIRFLTIPITLAADLANRFLLGIFAFEGPKKEDVPFRREPTLPH